MQVEAKTLVRRLTKPATRALEGAVGAAASAGHYEITVEHPDQLPDEGEGRGRLGRGNDGVTARK